MLCGELITAPLVPPPAMITPRPVASRMGTDIVSPVNALLLLGVSGQGISDGTDRALLSALLPHVQQNPVAGRWIAQTLSCLESFKSAKDGWDGQGAAAPPPEAIQSAEALAAFFVNMPAKRRPVVSVDHLGRPTYASSDTNFYLHLTVDKEIVDGFPSLTWYAVVDGQEYFKDEVPFGRRTLPDDLRGLVISQS